MRLNAYGFSTISTLPSEPLKGANISPAAKSKKQRRLASKAARALKTGTIGTSHVVRVPLEEQSIDLPAGMGEGETMRAQEAREELNWAMRTARRRRIKESNFLRGMR